MGRSCSCGCSFSLFASSIVVAAGAGGVHSGEQLGDGAGLFLKNDVMLAAELMGN